MMITEIGNLVLFDQKNATVWQSFSHPTDALVPGQSLLEGMRLVASTSATNWTENQLYMTVQTDGLYAYVGSTSPQLYFSKSVNKNKTGKDPTKVTFTNGSLSISVQSKQSDESDTSIQLPAANSTQYMRLESDGHLRLYECSSYFKPVDERKPNLGCASLTPISCQEMQHHQLLTLTDVSYFDASHIVANATNGEDCKQACLKNCSCRAVMFRYGQNDSAGTCMWVTRVFSLQSIQPEIVHYNSSAYLKVQLSPSTSASNANKRKVMLGATLGATTILVLLVIAVILYVRRKKYQELDDELDFDQIPGMTVRYTFENLRECTGDFSKKLGGGGFGTVFEGKIDEERVAVKLCPRLQQGKKEFLAEVDTIGSIEHINLVRLIGFCAEKSERLLVYEYVQRGSLDRWIYYRHNNAPLDWCTRHMIILDIAKGLCYLHEGCRRIIAHLDIKPQNTLLYENFNAKLADFGLSKLMDRDQSKVMTMMRGTPGYLAPEWLTSQITEKVDVYSFGVVVMEVICGRKNIDISLPEESVQLIKLIQKKAEDNQFIDLIENHSEDMVLHQEEAVQLLKLAMWCLQNDSSRRPSMSSVVKVLEGSMNIETNIDCNLMNANPVMSVQHNQSTYSVPPEASILSGPR
ncbi:hypothetical protein VPH35_021236 [Triticum aestivum]